MKTLYTTYNNFAKRVSLIIAILFTAVGAILAEEISTWELVKDVSNLQVGDQIVITSGSSQNKPLYAMSTTQNTNNRGMTAVSQWFPLTIADAAQIITLEAGTKENTFAFNVGNGYLYAASSSSNHLKTQATNSDNGSWKIEIDNAGVATIKAQGTSTRNTLKYNAATNNGRLFSCYSSTSSSADLMDVQIYKCVGDEPETYTVTYDANGATSGTAPVDNEQYKSGARVKILGSNGLERTYYSFAGWNTQDAGEGDNYEEGEDFTITENTTLYAKWDCATYVNIAKGKPVNGTFNLNVTGTQYTCENGFVVSVTDIVPATGYHFDHITQTDVDAANVTINDNAKTITFTKLTTGTSTISVVFAINSHKVTWKLADGKIGESTADIVETYNYGATISKPDDPTRDGFNFAGWKEESTNEDVMATMPDNDLVYIAQWTAKPLTNYRTLCTYTIEYLNTYDVDHPNPSKYTIKDLPLTFEDPTSNREGYTFIGWDPATLDADTRGDQTVKAIWQVNSYSITYHTNGGDAIANGSYTILSPDYVLPTPTRTGYIFDGWYDNKGLTGTAITTIPQGTTGDKEYWAKWDCALASATVTGTFALVLEEQFQLTATAKDSEGNVITCPDDATYTWQRKDPSSGNWVIVTDGDADKTTLTYPSATVEHCGVYRCVIAYGDCQAESNVGTDDDGYKVRFFHLKGTFEGDWTKAYPFVHTAENGIAVCTLTLNAGQYFEFKIYDGISEYGNGGTIDRTITDWEYGSNNFNNTHLNTGADGDYVFTLDYNALLGSGYILTLDVTYPLSQQAAGHTIYYDNLVHNWQNVYYRIGHTGHNQNTTMELVPGTSHLYKCTTPPYDDFEAWQVANNVAWSREHSIYNVNTNDQYAITHATEYKKFVVVEDITLTPDADGTFVNGENCTYYPAAKQEGMKKHKATIIPATGGTITVSYIDHDGTAYSDFTSGNRDLAHTCLLTITAVADAGYTLGTLTVNDVPFTSGNVHTLAADAVIKVTATPNTYTISFDGNGADAGSTASVSGTYLTDVTLTTNGFTRTDYTFIGWNTKADGSGTAYANGATFSISQPTNTTLYAQWKPIEFTNYRTACTGLITWYVDGVVYASNEVEFGASISTLPTNPANDAIGCCADAFVGWTASTAQVIPAESIFLTLAEAQAKYPSVSSDMSFYAVFATAAKGVGTSTVVFSEMGYANGDQVTSVTTGDDEGTGDATIAFAKAVGSSNEVRYYNDGGAVRVYAGGTITVISTYAGANITKVVLTYANNDAVGDNAITAEPTGLTDNIWTGNAQSVTFTVGGSTGHRRIASISVTTDVNGRSYTNYVTHCETLSNPTLGAETLTYANGTAIDVKCGQRSSMNSAAVLTFPEASNLTCPITLTATPGFLLSTSKNDNSKYGQSVIVKPIKSEPNKGKITQKVYVRAEAAAGLSGQMLGTITVTGSEITETTINVNAEVMCTQYTLTVVDHLGNTISTTNYYEGNEVAEIAQPTPDDCSTNYTFDGWSTAEVTYGSLIYNKVSFPFTMPAEDVTLYPVYQVNKSADYHRVTKELGVNNWEGQYLIAFSNTVFADGNKGGTDAEAIGASGHFMNPGTNLVDDVVKANWGDSYNVKLVAVDGGYVMQTKDNKYNYITNNSSQGNTISISLDKSTAAKYPLAVVFKNDFDIEIKNPNNGAVFHCGSFFRFYLNSTHYPIYLYKKSPLYTTPLICGTIEAADAVVTSTAGQTIKVNVPVTLTSDLTQPNTIEKAISDNPNFSVTALENAGQHTIAIGYTPTATTDGTETANITLTASNNATTTFQVTGRHLPENFVIAAKWGDNWYVLPADMNSESITEGLLIEVDNPADPTKAIAAPNTTKYGLKSVYTSNGSQDRYANNGERLVFVENVDETTPVANQTLYNAGGDAQNSTNTNIQVYAQYKTETGGYYETNPSRYEWTPITTDLKDYTLTSAHTFATEAARTVSLDNHGIFGTLLQDKSYNGMVRLLPVDNFYAPAELQVVEWKQNSVSVMYTGAGTTYTTKVGDNEESNVLALSKIDHAVYSLSTADLTTATNQPLIITIKDDADAIIGAVKLTIPAIVATDKSSTLLGVSEKNAKATSIVVLDGATLTAATTKYTYDDITVYPGGNLIIDNGKSLGMYTLTLRAGSSWGAEEYEHKYPQFLLRGDYSNTSAQINLDYVTTQDCYYPLSVPEEVTIGDIKYPVDIYGNNVEKANTGSFQLKYYDGAQRATGATGWVVLDEKNITKLSPNSGYAFWGIPKKVSVNGAAGVRQTYGIHRIPIKIAADKLHDNEISPEEVTIQAYAAARPNDQGWNYLGNPYLAGLGSMNGSDEDLQIGLLEKEIVDGKWTGGWVYNEESVNNKVRYITITNDCQNFEALPVANAKISPFTTFFIQAASVDDQKIRLTAPASVLNVSSLPARRYAAQQETAKEITTGIILTGNDQTDRTGLLIADNFTEEYDFNADLSKFENSGINLYTIGKDGKLAYMAINQALAEQPIPVGYSAPAEGLYTIAFDEDRYNATDISALYLIDYDSNEKTNLLHTDYSFVTAAGTNNQRFALQVAFAPENATNVEWVGDATIQVGVEGNELILNNLPTDAAVQVFDALGRLMYHTPHAPTEMQLTLPTGYYLVRIADKQHAAVINTVIP